jgi:hypothetical protein
LRCFTSENDAAPVIVGEENVHANRAVCVKSELVPCKAARSRITVAVRTGMQTHRALRESKALTSLARKPCKRPARDGGKTVSDQAKKKACSHVVNQVGAFEVDGGGTASARAAAQTHQTVRKWQLERGKPENNERAHMRLEVCSTVECVTPPRTAVTCVQAPAARLPVES